MLTSGRRAADADIARDIYLHTIAHHRAGRDARRLPGAVRRATSSTSSTGTWNRPSCAGVAGQPEFTGEVAVVTGAASGIGRACATVLARKGCLRCRPRSRSPMCPQSTRDPSTWACEVDVTDPRPSTPTTRCRGGPVRGGRHGRRVGRDLPDAAHRCGELDTAQWRRKHGRSTPTPSPTCSPESTRCCALAPRGGRVVADRARRTCRRPVRARLPTRHPRRRLTQLARVAALEWAADGIRVNMVHPDAVFDTGLWTAELLGRARPALRAHASRSTSAATCSAPRSPARPSARPSPRCARDTFAATTGAQIPIDGGNDRVV